MGRLRFRYHFSDFFAVGFTGFGGTSFPTKNFDGIIKVQDRDQDGNADLGNGEDDLAISDAHNVDIRDADGLAGGGDAKKFTLMGAT